MLGEIVWKVESKAEVGCEIVAILRICQNVNVNVAKYEIVSAIEKKCREATRE